MKKLKLRYIVQIFHEDIKEWSDTLWTNHVAGGEISNTAAAMPVTKSLANKAIKHARRRWRGTTYLITLASVR